MKKSYLIIGLLLLAAAWYFFIYKAKKTNAEKQATGGTLESSLVSGGSGSSGTIKSSVTTPTENPGTTGSVLKFVPQKTARTLRQTVGTKSGQNTPIASGTKLVLYGTDGKGNYITTQGMVPMADVQITGILTADNTTAQAGNSATSDFTLSKVKPSSFN